MDVVALVAVVAAVADVAIFARAMTLLAGHGDVQAHQRKAGQVVIECDGGLPALGGVALLALRTQLACVNVAGAMATGAVGRQLLLRDDRRMTGVAGDLLMPARQIPVPVAGVVECRRLPLLVAVALLALCAEAAGVRVLALVAAEAILGDFLLQVAAAMAVLAIDAGVRALESEAGLLLVIEFGRFPTGGGVAVAALRAALAPMYVIRRVAGGAFASACPCSDSPK